MNSIRTNLWKLLIVLGLTLLPQPATAQRLYDGKRDEQAQAAMKIATDLQSGTLFDKQLKNLSLLAKRDLETTLLSSRGVMRAEINSFSTWKDVNCLVFSVKNTIALPAPVEAAEVEQKLDELNPKIQDASKALDDLEAEVECKSDPAKCPEQKPRTLASFFDRAGELKEIEESIASFKNSSEGGAVDVTAAVGEVIGVLGILETLYKEYRKRMREYNDLTGELLSLQIPLKKVALQALQIEAQHWKNILKIYARRGVEEANIRKMVSEYEATNKRLNYGYERVHEGVCEQPPTDEAFKPDNIEIGLRTLVTEARDRERQLAAVESGQQGSNQNFNTVAEEMLAARAKIVETLQLLHTATALAARGRTPKELADLRLAQEKHAYSIRRSGVMARAYQVTVSTGVRRLALYHKGGIKPSVIAQLIYTAATVAIPPVIAAK